MDILSTKELIDCYGEKKLLVPDFQRDYVWSELEWGQMWNDLIHTEINAREVDTAQHFMGIVTFKKAGKECFELLDGQQRLTTAAILLDYLSYCNSSVPKIEFEKWNVQEQRMEINGTERGKTIYARLFNFFAKKKDFLTLQQRNAQKFC